MSHRFRIRVPATFAVVAGLALTGASLAQEKAPLSPPAKAEATIGDQTITVDYSSPRVRGREIFGGLVPYGKVWRTGANAATTLTTSGDLMIGALHVPAGKYTLFTIPGEKEWTLIVNKQNGQWGTQYDEKQDLGRVPMTAAKLDPPREEMTIEIQDVQGRSAVLVIEWANVSTAVALAVH